jgi:hypothetical protein
MGLALATGATRLSNGIKARRMKQQWVSVVLVVSVALC